MTDFYLKLRRPADGPLVALCLCRRDGAAHAGLLYGEVLPAVAQEIAARLGVSVERSRQLVSRALQNARGLAEEVAA